MAVVCARFSHSRPALMRRMAHHVGAALPAAVPPCDVAAMVAALARAGQREERFLALAAAYGKEHAEARLAAMDLEAHALQPVGAGTTAGGGGGGAAAVHVQPATVEQIWWSGELEEAGNGAAAVGGRAAGRAGQASRDGAGRDGGGGADGGLPVRAPFGESRMLSGATARARAGDEEETSRTAAAQVAAQAAAVVAMAQMTIERRSKGLPPGLLAGGADAASSGGAVVSSAAWEADAGAGQVAMPLGGAVAAPWGNALAEAPPPVVPAVGASGGTAVQAWQVGQDAAAEPLAGRAVSNVVDSSGCSAAAAPVSKTVTASRATATGVAQGCSGLHLEAEAPAGQQDLAVPEPVVLEELFAAEAAAEAPHTAWQQPESASQPLVQGSGTPNSAAHTAARAGADVGAAAAAGSRHVAAAAAVHVQHGQVDTASPGATGATTEVTDAGQESDTDAAAAEGPALSGRTRYRRLMRAWATETRRQQSLDPRTVLLVGNVQFSNTPME